MDPSELQALVLSGTLVAAVGFALFSPKVSSSLISLFYSSVILAVIFTLYGDTFVGLVQMATFAGAVSVLMLSVILMTGESRFAYGSRRAVAFAATVLLMVVAAAFVAVEGGGYASAVSYPDISGQVLTFHRVNRPWDPLMLIVAFASAMVTVSNLMSRER